MTKYAANDPNYSASIGDSEPPFSSLDRNPQLRGGCRLGYNAGMKTKARSQFIVRSLQSEAELAECLALDHSYQTDQAWQMDLREDRDDITVRFRPVRLPRAVVVEYPRDAASLARLWERRDCFLVAEAQGVILGYVNMRLSSADKSAWVEDLVVHSPFRRHRIGSALLEQASERALESGLQRITMAVQTKNHPAIAFAQTNGFVFCGYNDHYYANRDIALFFGKSLR